MRIVFLSWRDLAHPQAGGSEVVVDRLAHGLSVRGHEVTLLAGGPSATHVYRAARTGGTFSQYLGTPARFHADRLRPDVVVDVENGIPFFAPIWQRAPVVCLVHHVHTEQWAMQFPGPIAAVGRWLERSAMPKLYRRSDFVAVSRSTADALSEIGIPRDRVATIEMGLQPVSVSGPRSSDPRFLVLGRLVPHKRVDLALRLWPRVRERTGGDLVIVGDGPELDRLKALASPGVVFMGSVDEATKGAELGAAWVLVHPAHHEGWGTVVMEAAAAGVPTVGFDVAGVRDSVVDGTTGLLAAGEEAFASAWIGLGTDGALRHSMGEAARARAATFTWQGAVDAFEEVLERARGRV